MRYRDLLTVLFLVATASWIWAEPTRAVKVATPASATDGWTVPNLDLEGSTQRIEQAGEETPRAAAATAPKLQVRLQPGEDFASTTFEVALRAREGIELRGRGLGTTSFTLSFDQAASGVMTVNNPRPVGPNRWRFHGSDLSGLDSAAISRLEHASVVVSALVIDENQSRYSRGANFVIVESEPVQLSFR